MAFVWQIRIEGAGVYEGDLHGYLGERGIRVGTLKSKVDVKQLCRDLEWRYPQTAWVQADWRGRTLVIRLVEGVPAPQVASYGEAGDVVADRGGIILSVEPQAGTALVKPGDIVTPGQILIKGEEKRGTEETIWVKARGHVWARVWDRVAVELPMTLNLSEATGRSATVWEIDLPGKSFSFAEEPSYDLMDIHSQMVPIGGCWWPVWLKQSVYEEVTLRQELRPEEEVKAEAGLIAMRLLREKVGLGDELVDKWVDYCMIDGGKLAAYATAERRVDIAGFVPYSQTPPSR